MFIKNIRKTKYIGALGVATILALTSCKKEEKQQEKLLTEEIERNPETEIVTIINQATKPCVDIIEEIQDMKKNPEDYIEEITFLEDIKIYYNDSFNSLWIYPKREIEKNERSKRRILSKNKFTNQST